MKRHPILTPAMERVLRWMIEEDEELVCEGIEAWVGLHKTTVSTAYRLLREVLVRDVSDTNSRVKRYIADDDAKCVLSDPNYETRWREHLRTGKDVNR